MSWSSFSPNANMENVSGNLILFNLKHFKADSHEQFVLLEKAI